VRATPLSARALGDLLESLHVALDVYVTAMPTLEALVAGELDEASYLPALRRLGMVESRGIAESLRWLAVLEEQGLATPVSALESVASAVLASYLLLATATTVAELAEQPLVAGPRVERALEEDWARWVAAAGA
jgi:hypothetical protein